MKLFTRLLLLPFFLFSPIVNAQSKEYQAAFDNYRKYEKQAQETKDSDKEKAIQNLRKSFNEKGYRMYSINIFKMSAKQCQELLTPEGVFSDLAEKEQEFRKQNAITSTYSAPQQALGLLMTEAFTRLWKIAEAYRKGELSEKEALSNAYLNAIKHYGTIEANRTNNSTRFHASCFAVPTATVNIYFSFLKQMEDAERGKNKQLTEMCDMLKAISLQAWTQPFRGDATDENVVQIERFRNHVWWVGGNALGYRSLLPVSAMFKSIPMVDLLSEVCQKGISMTSQNTYDNAFWTEGFTADGAGWGHGMQCLIWGYPIDGTSNALNLLTSLKGTPWAKKLTRENAEALLNYMRGGNWYYFKGYHLPCLDRSSMVYDPIGKPIRYSTMLNSVIKDWGDSFTNEELAELQQLSRESNENYINMSNLPAGMYSGSRWFFNNDDLIKKTPNYHIIVNMASVRCDGLESATKMADEYNFYTTDGLTLFQKRGNEYNPIYGAFDVTASPGVTAREGMEKLEPVTNWRGYCSKHNFAAAATLGGENAVAGYIFEKMNASTKEGVNDKGSAKQQNDMLYGVKAYKSYFMLGDYFVALGAGVTNVNPEMEGTIRTTIDQTALVGEITLLDNGAPSPAKEGIQPLISCGKAQWIIQKNKFAYTVLPQYLDNAFYTCETKETDWEKRNSTNRNKKNLPATVNILRLWVDHGQKPVNDTYGYVVYSGRGLPATQLPFTVLQNDTTVQAICSNDKNVIEAVFYDKNATLKSDNISLSVSAPCAVLIEQTDKELKISATDAQMNPNLKEIIVTFNGKDVNLNLPQGQWSGKPATITLKK